MDAKAAGLIKKTAKKKRDVVVPTTDTAMSPDEGYESLRRKSLAQSFITYKLCHISIPKDYRHCARIEMYTKARGRFDNIDPRITDENFLLATNMLNPGEDYTIVIAYVNAVMSSKDCLKYIEDHEGIFLNAQGLTFVAEQLYEQLPVDAWVVAFDKPERLHKIDEEPKVPMIRRTPGQGHSIMLGNFSGKWRPRFVGDAGHAIIYAIRD
jgi:hypothetical protein